MSKDRVCVSVTGTFENTYKKSCVSLNVSIFKDGVCVCVTGTLDEKKIKIRYKTELLQLDNPELSFSFFKFHSGE